MITPLNQRLRGPDEYRNFFPVGNRCVSYHIMVLPWLQVGGAGGSALGYFIISTLSSSPEVGLIDQPQQGSVKSSYTVKLLYVGKPNLPTPRAKSL